jgi:hypothetical protein
MKKLLSVVGGAALAVSLAAAPVDRAKADGGTIAIGVGAYLVVDYLVGEKCYMYKWPFNIIKKTAYKLKGKPVCKYYREDRRYKHYK